MRFRFHAPRSLAPTTGATECPPNLEHNSFGISWDSRRSSFGIFEWRCGKCLQLCSARPTSWCSSGIDRIAWKDRHPGDLSISVDLSTRETRYSWRLQALPEKQPTMSGPSKLTTSSSLWRQASPVILSLHLEVWRQIRGAGIGSQISPTISNLAVTMVERAWQHSFEALLSQKPLNSASVRCVDNRFAVFDSACQVRSDCHLFWPEFLWTPSRAGDPMLLGFNVSVSERIVTVPINKFEILHQLGLSVSGCAAWKAELTWWENIHFRHQQLNLVYVSLHFRMYSDFSPSEVYHSIGLLWSQKWSLWHTSLVCEPNPVRKGCCFFAFSCAIFSFNVRNRGLPGLL